MSRTPPYDRTPGQAHCITMRIDRSSATTYANAIIVARALLFAARPPSTEGGRQRLGPERVGSVKLAVIENRIAPARWALAAFP
jgi:hypothetical protein